MYGGSDVRPKKFSLLPKNINSEQKKNLLRKKINLSNEKNKICAEKIKHSA